MSEVEKLRALTLVALLTLALAGGFAYQSRDVAVQHSGVRDALELCAASKGALCDETAAGKVAGTDIADVHDLGHIVVTATRVADEASDLQIAFLGSITVTAPRA